LKTVEYEVEGPVALLFSTTSGSIAYENANRCFELCAQRQIDIGAGAKPDQAITLAGFINITRIGATHNPPRN